MSINRRTFLSGIGAAGAMITGCTATSSQTAGTRRSDGGPVIDIHAHWHAPAFVSLLEKEGAANGAKIGRSDKGYVTFMMPGIGSVFQPQYIVFEKPVDFVDKLTEFNARDRDLILGGNAQRLLRL